MSRSTSRRGFLRSALGAGAVLAAGGRAMAAPVNKRDALLSLLAKGARTR